MKKHYLVGVREVNARFYSVYAENEEEAKDLVHQRASCVVDCENIEYSHELDRDTWSVEEIPNNEPSADHNQESGQP